MLAHQQNTLSARLTPAGRGAVATIRLTVNQNNAAATNTSPNFESDIPFGGSHRSDLAPLFKSVSGLTLSTLPVHKIAFGNWGTTNCEEVVVCRIKPNAIEIHCHGGNAAVERILQDLSLAGFNANDWRDQESSTSSIFDSECADILSKTSTWRTTKIALTQVNELLKSCFDQLKISVGQLGNSSLRETLSGSSTAYPEQTERSRAIGFGQKPSTMPGDDCGANDVKCPLKVIENLLNWANFGHHLSTPWSVVLTGRPNVGKSSLINAMLGYQRAIVFDQPGTTRDIVTAETAFEGWPIVLADTAGIRESAGGLEAAGIALAQKQLESADEKILVIDSSQSPTDEDQMLIEQWPNAIVVANKSDLANQWGDHLPKQAIPVSSVTGQGVLELQRIVVNRLVPKTPSADTPIPITMRQIQILREFQAASTDEQRRDLIQQL